MPIHDNKRIWFTFSSRGAQSRLFFAISIAIGVAFAPACSDSRECVVDTDCEVGNRCEAETCVPLNPTPEGDAGPAQDGSMDAGVSEDAGEDAGAPEDAGEDAEVTEDAATFDGGSADAGTDSGQDAGPPPACDFDGSYAARLNADTSPFCSEDMLTCSIRTASNLTMIDCGAFSYDCVYGDDCRCASAGVPFMGGSAGIVADPSSSAIDANGKFGRCSYTLTAAMRE
ncbi:MAG: hypothetical protein AB8H86_27550 [Polyangiales bacterium]